MAMSLQKALVVLSQAEMMAESDPGEMSRLFTRVTDEIEHGNKELLSQELLAALGKMTGNSALGDMRLEPVAAERILILTALEAGIKLDVLPSLEGFCDLMADPACGGWVTSQVLWAQRDIFRAMPGANLSMTAAFARKYEQAAATLLQEKIGDEMKNLVQETGEAFSQVTVFTPAVRVAAPRGPSRP